MQTLEELIVQLPAEMRQEVRDFAAFLLEKRQKKSKSKPTFDWAGALQDLRDQYTSVQLQHQMAEWRIGGQ